MACALPRFVVLHISRSVKLWVTFAGCVLVVAVLYWAQAVLMPVALAILLSFVLGPLVARLQRWIGRHVLERVLAGAPIELDVRSAPAASGIDLGHRSIGARSTVEFAALRIAAVLSSPALRRSA